MHNEAMEILHEDYKLAKEFAKILGREIPAGHVEVTAERNQKLGSITALVFSAEGQHDTVVCHSCNDSYEVTTIGRHFKERDFLDALVRVRFEMVRDAYPESFEVLGC